jgi:hypothetical protein
MTGRHGPIPDPVATRTIERKRGAIRRTPHAGTPRIPVKNCQSLCVTRLEVGNILHNLKEISESLTTYKAW